jgi:hypothetical protein
VVVAKSIVQRASSRLHSESQQTFGLPGVDLRQLQQLILLLIIIIIIIVVATTVFSNDTSFVRRATDLFASIGSFLDLPLSKSAPLVSAPLFGEAEGKQEAMSAISPGDVSRAYPKATSVISFADSQRIVKATALLASERVPAAARATPNASQYRHLALAGALYA